MQAWNNVFIQCLERDIQENTKWTWHASEVVHTKPLWTAGFFDFLFKLTESKIYELGGIAKLLAEYEGSITIQRVSLQDLRKAHRGRVVILDEVPPIPPNASPESQTEKMVKAARNMLRRAHICVVMMGTDSSISNLVKRALGTRCEPGIKFCHLICRLAPFSPSAEQNEVLKRYPIVVQEAILTANPLFATKAIEVLARYLPEPSSIGATFECIRENVWSFILLAKFSAREQTVNIGQKAMLQSAFNLNSQATTKKLPPSLINGHFAQLLVDPSWQVAGMNIHMVTLLNSGGKLSWQRDRLTFINFDAVAVMPCPYRHPLMHFVLAGPAERGPFIPESAGAAPPTLTATFSELSYLDQNSNNGAAAANWEAWESLSTAAAVVASRLQPIGATMSFDDWLLRLFFLLQGAAVSAIGTKRWEKNGAPSVHAKCVSLLQVPFLLPCGTHEKAVADVQPTQGKKRSLAENPSSVAAKRSRETAVTRGTSASAAAASASRVSRPGAAAASVRSDDSLSIGLCERLSDNQRMDGVIKRGEFHFAGDGLFDFNFGTGELDCNGFLLFLFKFSFPLSLL